MKTEAPEGLITAIAVTIIVCINLCLLAAICVFPSFVGGLTLFWSGAFSSYCAFALPLKLRRGDK